ncbi:MAG: threonine--tRNA ligase [Candidatus Shapirobacteria bacterium]|nr:threonine--tRNA ligase [Candidatus Shapirobacteria bacterium]MDD4410405.1 threonine--tRNA ligase [Candidatus Shapirobacteria bacterium]
MNSTIDSKKEIQTIRHSAEHVLTQAMQRLFPNKFLMAMGPATDDGFYFDFEPIGEFKVSDADFPAIETEMAKIVKENLPIIRQEISLDDAKKLFADNPYKMEWLNSIQDRGEIITIYKTGDEFTDLCAGPHVRYTKGIKAFKLLSIAGAYWHGDEKNKMLTRIYGTAFESKPELEEYLNLIEEAKKRDHRILGQKLKLFTISKLVGAGLPLLQPNGMIIRKELEQYLWDLHKNKGYSQVWTPHITKEELYITSGHAEKFGDNIFKVQGKDKNEIFYLKPMNCPHHMQIFADNQFSYRDMPVRYFEPATVYRDEKAGELSGLTRVRAITQDDGHLFCRTSQLETEITTIVGIIKEFYTTFGMMENYWVRLSTRGPKGKYLGSNEIWEKAETALKSISDKNQLPYKIGIDEAAFYGPKLDFMFKDALKREWQLATIQCDFNLPERFDLSFTNEKGEKERPVVIHRAISGSIERFMGILIEQFGGAFPTWISPVQVKIIPITDCQLEYAQNIEKELKENGIRVEIDDKSETMQNKIRNAAGEKIPYMIIIGGREAENNTISVRQRDGQDLGIMPLSQFIDSLKDQISKKSLNLVK